MYMCVCVCVCVCVREREREDRKNGRQSKYQNIHTLPRVGRFQNNKAKRNK
jgi:hypothetical protein